MDEERLTAAQIAAMENCAVSRRIRNSQRSPLSKARHVGKQVNVIKRANGSLGVGSRQGSRKEHTISRLEIASVCPDRHDHPRTISSWCVRQRRFSSVGSRANVSVNGIYPGRSDFNENFSRGNLQVGHLDQIQDLRLAEAVDANCLHGASIDLPRAVAIRAVWDAENTCQTRSWGPKIQSPA
jgi:hypothetical protein